MVKFKIFVILEESDLETLKVVKKFKNQIIFQQPFLLYDTSLSSVSALYLHK